MPPFLLYLPSQPIINQIIIDATPSEHSAMAAIFLGETSVVSCGIFWEDGRPACTESAIFHCKTVRSSRRDKCTVSTSTFYCCGLNITLRSTGNHRRRREEEKGETIWRRVLSIIEGRIDRPRPPKSRLVEIPCVDSTKIFNYVDTDAYETWRRSIP